MATAGDSSPASTAAPAPEKANGEKADGEKPMGDGVTTKQFGDANSATPEASNHELERSFSFLSSFGQAFAMLNSWTAA